MALEKNITMREYNGNDYNTLYPKTKSTLMMASDKVIDDLVLSSNANVDEALQVIANKLYLISENYVSINLTVQSTSGNLLSGIEVNGIFDANGNTLKTNSNGIISGYMYVSNSSATFSISGYGDVEDYSETMNVVIGESYTKTISLTTRNFLKITSSRNIKFSGNVSHVDVTVVGGGGGGGNSHTSTHGGGVQYILTGGGGGGGYCTVQKNVNFTANVFYSAIVGAGGAVKADGGFSSFLGVLANGGSAGGNGSDGGGAGNGRGGHGVNYSEIDDETESQGGNGVAGSVAGYSSFTDTVVYGGGGGAGSGGSFTVGGSGAGYGGNGSAVNNRTDYPGTAGADGFGGGGGGAGGNVYSNDFELCAGTKGGSGCVAIRMHLLTA